MLRTCLLQLSLLAAIFVQAVSAVAAAAALRNGQGGSPCPAAAGGTPALLNVQPQDAVSAVQERRRKRFGPGDSGWGEWWLSDLLAEIHSPGELTEATGHLEQALTSSQRP
ncbi:hypothetical protein C6P46_005122 [Rhodotorula mucilaginosa]|jgi:hypothetical protein|uniref:Uncharacterized protein n=1 Tax=Rhodotorula mucilaginosa TaxID=5537 RepID=A0A9P7B4V5_RHOMI|nr:hypothetical protein C6P46_005122 [Rhodotorula mucilaginosa]